MRNTINASLFFLAAGVFTSVTVLSAYQVLFAIPMIYYVSRALKEKEFALPTSAWILLSFTLVALLSLVVNFELIPRPSKNFGRLKYFLFGIAGIFVFRHWLPGVSDRTKKVLLNVFFVSIIAAGFYALYNFLTMTDGRVKAFTDTMRYGYGSGMILLVLLSAILHREKTRSWLDLRLAVPALLVGFMGMYLTYARGALLGFLCGLPFVIYFYRARLGVIFAGISLAAVLTLGGFYLYGSGSQESRFLMNKNNASDVIRRSQWKAAIISIQEKPVLGWGLSNFHSQLKRIKEENNLDAKDYNDAHSHNLFLEITSGTGLIGGLIFLAWVVCWALEMFSAGGLTRALIVPLGVAFVVSSQFEVTFDANNASMIFFLYAISVSPSKRPVKR